MDKTDHGPVIAIFSVQLQQLFSYVGGIPNQPFFTAIDWYVHFGDSANHNIQGAFVILFLICGNLLNFLRSLGTTFITTESGWNSLRSHFYWTVPAIVAIFRCVDVCSVRPPQIFQAEAKMSEYLSFSYGYGLNFVYLNINSLSPKIKALPVLGKLTNALVIGISEYKLE